MYLYTLGSTDWHEKPPGVEDSQVVIMDLRTVIHPQLYMTVSQYKSSFTNRFCHNNGVINILSRRPFFLKDTDHDTVLN